MQPLRIIFMGTPELAGECLAALLPVRDFNIVAVVTQPDRPKGRALKLTSSPVKQIALAAGRPVLQPLSARAESFVDQLREFEPELIAVAAFGQILPKSILELPRHGCLNVHTSLLPRYRGAAPIQAALRNGDSETGITIMKMDVGLDTGDILRQRAIPIAPADNAKSLHDRLARFGAELLVATILDYVAGRIRPQPQPAAGVSYAPKLTKEQGRIDWHLPATDIWNHVRAFTPWPGAFTQFNTGPADESPARRDVRLKIWQAEVAAAKGPPGTILHADRDGILVGCGREALRITSLQCESGRCLTASEFLSGHRLQAGNTFS